MAIADRAALLRYALAPACVAAAVLLHLSPAGPYLHPTGLFLIFVIAAAWFGGAGPGFLAAVLATFALPQLIPMSYPLVGGFFDLPRFVTFAVTGLAVGWGATRRTRAEAALRQSERELRARPRRARGQGGGTDRALRLSEERYALAMQASGEGHWDWKIGTDEYYTSPRHLEILGLPPGTTSKGRAEALKRIPYHPEDRAKYDAAVAAHFAGKTPRVDIQLRLLVRGELRWVHAIGMCLRDAAGVPMRWAGSMTDITEQKRAEEALRLSEERYARAMEASDDGLWEWYPATDAMFLSPRARQLFGIADGAQIRTRADVKAHGGFHPEDLPRIEAAIQASRALESGGLDIEYRVVRRRGEVRWIRSRGKVFPDAQGRPALLTGSLTDITERKKAEQALLLSEERYARAMEGSDAGHWDWNIVTDEMFVSPRAREMLALPAGTLPARRSDIMALVPQHPDDRASMDEQVRSGIHSATHERDYRVIPRPGEVRWLRSRGKVYKDARGAAVRMTGSLTDITERKLAGEALRESEKRYQRAMLAAEAGFWDWDMASDQFYVSPKLLEQGGFAPGTRFAGRADFMARAPFHPDDRAKWAHAVKDLFVSGGTRLAMELRVVLDGETRWHNLSGICIRDDAGAILRWAGSSTDVTARKSAEEALRASEERYALALQASEEGHFDVDLETDELFVSERLNEIYGFAPHTQFASRSEYLKHARFHPDDLDAYGSAVKAAEAQGGPDRYEFEYRIVPRPGEIRWLHTRGQVIRDAAGRARRRIGVVTDITERKLAADVLRASEARFRGLTELSSDWYWKQDENLRFTYMSNQAVDLGALPAPSPIGKTRWELRHLTPLSCSWAEHHAVLAARQPFRDFELSRVMPDGSVGYFSVSGAPVFDEHGRFQGYHGTGRSITERKRIEEELRSRQEMLDLAQKSARATAFEWRIGTSGEGQNRWSPDLEVMYGLAPGTYDGSFETWKKLVHPDDWPAVKEAVKHAQRTGDVAAEYRVVHPDGSVHWLNAKGRMFFDREGKPVRMVGFMHDVTERRQAEEELKRMERQLRQAQRLEAMGTLAGGIAHDFNNILGAILGYGEMALRDAAKGSRLRRDLDSIITAGERGRALVDRVLAFSRSGVGERVAVHVEKVVREALDLLSAKLPPNVTLHAKLHAGPAAMLGDATQVHQVLMNLATNAIQAMPLGGTLRVSLDAVSIDAARVPTIGSDRRGGLPGAEGRGYRHRYRAGNRRADIRSVLHHQGRRHRHRPGAFAGARHRHRARRRDRRREHARRGQRVHGLSAALRRRFGFFSKRRTRVAARRWTTRAGRGRRGAAGAACDTHPRGARLCAGRLHLEHGGARRLPRRSAALRRRDHRRAHARHVRVGADPRGTRHPRLDSGRADERLSRRGGERRARKQLSRSARRRSARGAGGRRQ